MLLPELYGKSREKSSMTPWQSIEFGNSGLERGIKSDFGISFYAGGLVFWISDAILNQLENGVTHSSQPNSIHSKWNQFFHQSYSVIGSSNKCAKKIYRQKIVTPPSPPPKKTQVHGPPGLNHRTASVSEAKRQQGPASAGWSWESLIPIGSPWKWYIHLH